MTTSHPSGSEDAGSSRAFDRLAEPVRRWIWQKRWTALRDIQERAVPLLLDSDDDAIIAAATAGGKTEAAFLPLISAVLDGEPRRGFDLVYVGPLRALINDQFRRLEELCEGAGIPVHPWHGDIAQGVKARARKNPRGILLITPESLEALFVLRGPEIPVLFSGTTAIVVDELHALLDSERGIHLRSLLNRLEITTGRRIRRIGLSATLGEMALARAYLRPEAPEAVRLLESRSEGQELQVQLRGYRIGGALREVQTEVGNESEAEELGAAANRAIAEHIFEKLRGSRNLVFAGSRQNVEIFADLLRDTCESRHLPNEFFPHHASLSREHRGFVEGRLKRSELPATAICTSTLELGIDIGEISCVGQIGPPWSVASLRQRLGRSGRRAGQPAVLRMYVAEPELTADSNPLDTLRLDLVRSIAMIDLLIEGWCEPPRPQALHLSTLTHQILSVIAEYGGVRARTLFGILCTRGPFRQVDAALFARLLRRLGDPEVALIEQAPDGTLLLGREGERLVEHYSFYAVFQTSQEYRVLFKGRALGTVPITTPLAPGLTIIFSGRRWKVDTIHEREKVIEVVQDRSGRPPRFGGGAGVVDDVVVDRMRAVYEGTAVPAYLDRRAAELLAEARASYLRLGLHERQIIQVGAERYLLATWRGTVKSTTLALALNSLGTTAFPGIGFVEATPMKQAPPLRETLERLATQAISGEELLSGAAATLVKEKFHPYLDFGLLSADAVGSYIEPNSLLALAREMGAANGL